MWVNSALEVVQPADNSPVIQLLARNIAGPPTLHLLLLDFGAYYKVPCVCVLPCALPLLILWLGWITTAAWCFACGGPPSILANIITSLVIFNYENYVPERWHTSLIMIAVMVVPLMFNLWFRKLLDAFEMTGGILHITLFIVVIVILIVFGPRNDPDFVFKNLTSDVSGWNNPGVSWGLGLLSMTFSVTGADSVLHMCMFYAHGKKNFTKTIIGDEVKKVRTRVPRSIIMTCTVNSAMLIVFATILLFYMGPLTDEIVATPLPLLWIIYNITGSKVATNVLVSLIAVIFFFALFNIFASVSRLVWVFARDNGLPFSKFFSYVSSPFYPFILHSSLIFQSPGTSNSQASPKLTPPSRHNRHLPLPHLHRQRHCLQRAHLPAGIRPSHILLLPHSLHPPAKATRSCSPLRPVQNGRHRYTHEYLCAMLHLLRSAVDAVPPGPSSH